MLIRKAFRYRLYPNVDQQQQLAVNFGQARFVYNYFLAERKQFYSIHKADPEKRCLTYYDNAKCLTEMKRDPQYAWLKEGHSQVLQQSIKDLDRAYQNFFANRTKFPKFHKKHERQAIRYPQNTRVGEKWLELPKIGRVKAVIHRPWEGKIKNVTVTKTKSGRYFASVQVEMEMPVPPPYRSETVGVDMGLKSFLVTSDAVAIPAPKYLLRAQKRLTRSQRRLSRSKKGSHGWEKARAVVARQYEKVANQRSDFLHKTSYWLVDKYGLVGIEDLHVRGMVTNRKLARAISDAGWGELRRQLTYKGLWYDTRVVIMDRFFPSSRRCSVCGYVLCELKLSVREWDCPQCGIHHDRDLNAAMNIKMEAQTRAGIARSNAGGEDVRPPFSEAVLNEPGSHPL
jgi:putative transposase